MDSKNKTRRAIIPKRTLIYIFIFIYTLSTESLATLFQFYFETFSFSKKIYNFYKKRTNSFTEIFLLLENFDRSNRFHLEIRFIEIRYIEIRFIEIRFVWRISKLYDVYQWLWTFRIVFFPIFLSFTYFQRIKVVSPWCHGTNIHCAMGVHIIDRINIPEHVLAVIYYQLCTPLKQWRGESWEGNDNISKDPTHANSWGTPQALPS